MSIWTLCFWISLISIKHNMWFWEESSFLGGWVVTLNDGSYTLSLLKVFPGSERGLGGSSVRLAWLCHFGQLNTQNPYSNFMLLQTPDFGSGWYNTVLVKTFFSFLNPIRFSFSRLQGPDHSHKGICSISSPFFFWSLTDRWVAEVTLIP